MAFREARVYHRPERSDDGAALNFTFYMDAVMRGRFREYSGPEVKGINIVNLMLCEPAYFEEFVRPKSRGRWGKLLNTYNCHVAFDYSKLTGTVEENTNFLIDTFVKRASTSKIPQMKTLVKHIKESRRTIDMKSVIRTATDYLVALRKRVAERQKNAA